MKKSFITFAALAGFVALLASCSDRRKPGRIYMPDMTYSRAYESYTANPNFADGLTARKPVEGTVKRGELLPYHLKDDSLGYALSAEVKNPLNMTETDLAEGKRLFNIYCAICHGTGLDGQGPLVKSGKYLAAPANFKDARYIAMPEGTMFHSITYGKNLMGSYASQVDRRQRWMIVAYIKSVQGQSSGTSTAASDSTSTAK